MWIRPQESNGDSKLSAKTTFNCCFCRNIVYIGKDRADKNFGVLEQYKMPIGQGLIIDTSDRIFPLNRDAWYCPVGMIGL